MRAVSFLRHAVSRWRKSPPARYGAGNCALTEYLCQVVFHNLLKYFLLFNSYFCRKFIMETEIQERHFKFYRLWPLAVLAMYLLFCGCSFKRNLEKEKAVETEVHHATSTKTIVVYGLPPNAAQPQDAIPEAKLSTWQKIFGKKAVTKKNSATQNNAFLADLPQQNIATGLVPISATVITNDSNESGKTTSFSKRIIEKIKGNLYYVIFGIVILFLIAVFIWYRIYFGGATKKVADVVEKVL